MQAENEGRSSGERSGSLGHASEPPAPASSWWRTATRPLRTYYSLGYPATKLVMRALNEAVQEQDYRPSAQECEALLARPAWGLPSASALLVLWFTALNKGKWPPFRTHWYDYLLYGTTGFLLDSEHASAAVLDSVLHLCDSPLAGECAAIVKAKNPSARLDGIAGSLGLRIPDRPDRAGARLSRGAADSVATAAADTRAGAGLQRGACPGAAARPAAPAAVARGRPGSSSPEEDGWGDGAAWGSLNGDLEPVDAAASRAASQAEAWGRQREAGAGRGWHPRTGGGGGQWEAGGWDAPGGREDASGTGAGADPQGDPLKAWSLDDAWSPDAREQTRAEGYGPAAGARDAEPGAAPATSHARRRARQEERRELRARLAEQEAASSGQADGRA